MSFRKILFWVHLVAGLVAGTVIGIMCFTGAVLAFEDELVAWSERDARRVVVPAGDVQPLPLDELIDRARAAAPEAKVSAVTVQADPAAAVSVSFGRELAYHVNPYTGDVRQPASTAVHDFMHTMVAWHRWLAQEGDDRPLGKAITGASNTAFLLLALTGLYLWWPRQWTARALRPSLWFVRARGKARDWNWHNVIGFWSLPVLIILTASGMVISYRWASDLVYRTFGEAPPQQRGPGAFAGGSTSVTPPSPDATPLSTGALFTAAQGAVTHWESISLRLGPPRGGAGAAAAGNSGPQAVQFSVREQDRFPTFGSTTVLVDPFTGQVLQRNGFSDLSAGRQARMWMRWLHVGQGFGWFGQLIAALACIGGLVLVYTGFALAWRRFFPRRAKSHRRVADTPVTLPEAASAPAAAPAGRGE